MATELFINKSWTFSWKVPKKTAFGVDLVYEKNAFKTLEEAQRYASTRGLSDPIYHIYDKKVDFDNANLKLGKIRSQEIKSTVDDNPAKWSWSGKSKIVASATITVTDTAQNNLDIAGFQDVTLRNRSNNSGKYTVHGGSNTVAHSFVVTGANTLKVTQKDSATIRGIATGVLTVGKGAHVTKADGAWAEAASVSAGIASDNSAFIPSDPGLPAYADWGTQLMDSPLKTGLPGYYRVILEAGAKADVLYGGWMSYDHISDATYSLTNPSMIKSCNYQTNAVGMLFVSGGATVGSAYNYSTAVISGGNFTLLQGGNTQIVGKTTYSVPNASSYKETSEHFSSSTATGTAVLSGLASKSGARDVSGYATVSIIDTELDSVNAAGYRLLTKETEEKTAVNGKPKITYTYTDSKNYSQTGELSNPKGKVGGTFYKDVVGFGGVNLTGATFGGKLAAVVFEAPTEYYPDPTYFYASGNYSSSVNKVSFAGVKVQGKLNEKFTCSATGGVKLSASEVGKGIQGYRTVNLTDVKVGLGISAGGTSFDESSNDSRSLDGSISSSLTNRRNSTTAIGTLNMTGGSLSGGDIYEFATVTLNGVSGNVGRMDALNETASRRFNYSSGGALLEESYVSRYAAGVGQLTVNQGGKLSINGVYGYNKINVNGGTIANGIDRGWVFRSYDSSRSAYDPKAGISQYSHNSITSSAFGGSVQLGYATVAAGGIHGYQKVTLESATVSGGIGRLDNSGPLPPGPAPVQSGIYAPNFVSQYASSRYDNGGERLINALEIYATSTAAAMDLTLKDGAEVSGDIYGVKSLTVTGPGIAQIDGNVDMTSEADYRRASNFYDSKKDLTTGSNFSSTCRSATGTIALSGGYIGSRLGLFDVVGSDVVGVAKISAALMWAGNLNGRTSNYYSKTVAVLSGYSGGNIVSMAGTRSFVDSATGVATLSAAIVGDLDGFATVTLKEGLIGSANGATSREAYTGETTSQMYQHSSGASLEAGNTFKGDYTRVSGGIVGYKSIVLENGARVVGNIDCDQYKDSDVVKTMQSGGKEYEQTLTRENSTTPAATLTLKTAADVYGNVYGVKTANLTGGAEIFGDLEMNGWSEKETNKVTSNGKTKLFEQTWNSSDGMVGGATLSLNNAYLSDDEDTDWTEGSVYGATKVTMTDAEIAGDVYGGSSYFSSSIVAKGSKIQSAGSSILSGATINVDSNYAVEWNEKDVEVTSAAGAFTMTEGMVGGAISGFATVKLTGEPGYTTVGRVTGGFTSALTSHAYKNQADTFAESTKEGVLGTLNAAFVTFTDADILAERFANVTLTDCTGAGGAIWGGFSEMSRNGIGNGANFAAASANAGSAAFNYQYAASGAVTATRTDLNGGDIINCATVTLTDCAVGNVDIEPDYTVAKTALTLAGSNTVAGIGGFAAVTVKGGDTVADGYTDTTGSDTFTVNAGAGIALYAMSFQGGDDKVTVNGTLRLLGGIRNAAKLTITGTGAIAVIDGNYDAVKGTLAAATVSGVELINAGETEGTVLAIRTRKEELADNTAKGARNFEGTSMNGWLSGDTAGEGKFADTEDWIKFKFEAGRDYAVTLEEDGRHGDVQVDLCRNGSVIRNVAWNGGRFDIDETALSAGTEYQLKLTTTENKSALAYAFTASPQA